MVVLAVERKWLLLTLISSFAAVFQDQQMRLLLPFFRADLTTIPT